ncbi:MAG: hypothetical protein AAGJ32_11520 [Pseudomonadota bacterium]
MAAIVALAFAPPATADGLVIESAAAGYTTGDIIPAGAPITLAEGESIQVLDQSGERIAVSQSGPYAGDVPASALAISGLSLADATLDPGRRADIGGTRADDYEACLAQAEVRDDLDREDCDRARQKSVSPELEIGLAVRAATFKPGDPLIFKLKSTFDARVFCSAAQAGDAQIAYPMELAGPREPLRLMGNVTAMAPQRGSPRLVAPDVPGNYRVECFAVDAETLETFNTATSEISDAHPETWLLRSYAEMRQAPFALGELTVTVTP